MPGVVEASHACHAERSEASHTLNEDEKKKFVLLNNCFTKNFENMKKSLFVLGVAVAALASCTQSEVLEVAENRAIGFDAFVNNQTKAVTEVETATIGTDFYVFGNYGTGGTWNGQAFNNEISTAVYYWQTGQTYRFGAYKDGDAKNATVQFDATTPQLTFPDYTPTDANDLIAAVTGDVTGTAAVGLNFKHLLSQVKLTFKTDAAAVYNMMISNVKINGALSQSTATYNGTVTWNPSAASSGTTTNNGYSYDALSNGGKISSGVISEQSKLVIPQSGTDALTVTFTAEITGEADGTANFTATLGHAISDLTENTWTNGYRYNYIATVELDKVIENPEGLVKITFTPTVEEWKDAEPGVDLPVSEQSGD